MFKVDDYFDRIVCMTLDRRFASGESTIRNDLASYGGSVLTFLAGDGKLFNPEMYGHIDEDVYPRRQAWNYGKCLLKILRQARDAAVRRLLYLEDDAALTPDFDRLFPEAMAFAAERQWDLFFLGGIHRNGPFERVNDCIIKPTYSLDLHAVVFSASAFDKLLDINPSAEHTIDGVIGSRQKNGLLAAYAVNPSIIIQRPGYSYNSFRKEDKVWQYQKL